MVAILNRLGKEFGRERRLYAAFERPIWRLGLDILPALH
jgi:hypothetical protein